MGRKISQEALRKHKEESLKTLETYIDSLINDENPKIQSKADKLSFWLEHWTTFLSFESKFRSTSLRRYKRGEIIKVHLAIISEARREACITVSLLKKIILLILL